MEITIKYSFHALVCALVFVCLSSLRASPVTNENSTLSISYPVDVEIPEGYSDTGAEELPELSNLNGFLQWAIKHSDAENLAKAAEDVEKLTPEELSLKRQHIRDVIDAMKMPSDAEMIQRSLQDLKESNFSVNTGLVALNELLELLEPIDNANDFIKMNGLGSLRFCMNHSDTEIRTKAVWVLGVAAQNNPTVQNKVLEEGLVVEVMQLSESADVDESLKALYALSACIRNNEDSQQWFLSHQGPELIQRLMDSKKDPRVQKKVVSLLSDLAVQNKSGFNVQKQTLQSMVSILEQSHDLDLIEKTMLTAINVVKSDISASSLLLELGIEEVLGGMAVFQPQDGAGVDQGYILELNQIRTELLASLLSQQSSGL